MQGDRGAYADIMRTSAAIDATGTAHVAPDHVRQRTADAIAQARMWHADAQLSGVEITPGQLGVIITVEVLSPSTGQGLWVFYERCATAPPMTHDAGTVSWSKAKLDTSFVDFDQAQAVARAHGLAGEIDHARLEQTDRGLFVWRISPKGTGDLIVDAHTGQSYTASQASTMDLGLPHLQGRPAGNAGQMTAATAGSPRVDWFTKSFGVMGPQIRANMQHGCTGGSQWKAGGRCE